MILVFIVLMKHRNRADNQNDSSILLYNPQYIIIIPIEILESFCKEFLVIIIHFVVVLLHVNRGRGITTGNHQPVGLFWFRHPAQQRGCSALIGPGVREVAAISIWVGEGNRAA